MTELEMEDVDSIPHSGKLNIDIEKASIREKREYLCSLAGKIVDKYILRDDKVQAIIDKTRAATEANKTVQSSNGERYMCRFPGCEKSFRYDGKRRRDHERTHDAGVVVNENQHSLKRDVLKDDMFNYQSSFLEAGLLLRNFYDAISEGDGQRLIRCWKFMLPYLKEDGQSSKKYALEAFYLICQINSLLSPRASHRLIWNRFHKLKHGRGGNIPLDLALEHYNRLIKILVRNLGPNALNKQALDRYCKALSSTSEMLDNFDSTCGVTRRSGAHSSQSTDRDLRKVVHELMQQEALRPKHGRRYSHFSGMKDNLLADHDVNAFFKWLNMHKKMTHLNRCAR